MLNFSRAYPLSLQRFYEAKIQSRHLRNWTSLDNYYVNTIILCYEYTVLPPSRSKLSKTTKFWMGHEKFTNTTIGWDAFLELTCKWCNLEDQTEYHDIFACSADLELKILRRHIWRWHSRDALCENSSDRFIGPLNW